MIGSIRLEHEVRCNCRLDKWPIAMAPHDAAVWSDGTFAQVAQPLGHKLGPQSAKARRNRHSAVTGGDVARCVWFDVLRNANAQGSERHANLWVCLVRAS